LNEMAELAADFKPTLKKKTPTEKPESQPHVPRSNP